MYDSRFSRIDDSEIDTLMAEDLEFEGNLEFGKSLMIRGRFKGQIKATGDLYIDEGADVEADIKARMVWLKGKVRGDIVADQRVEMFATASLYGDVTAPDVAIESGCNFNGICTMTGTATEAGETGVAGEKE
ncbi:MAG: polymer-forming cytoskeletal protein [Spirochaetales bacterium]|nr:polymer-forming cytoskeletal protein [Spirochaetales bacterium]MCF7937103.1 polymer-forming cytoskeletal protein [Spirochaetales bacterium]